MRDFICLCKVSHFYSIYFSEPVTGAERYEIEIMRNPSHLASASSKARRRKDLSSVYFQTISTKYFIDFDCAMAEEASI